MQTMTSVLHRQNSMTLLSLYDLETLTIFPDSVHTQLTTSQDKIKPSKSILEDLSNELLIDIFEFLSPYDLHRSIYNLNLRFNAICGVQKLYLNMAWTKRTFDYYCTNQQPFASQIYSLKIDDGFDRLTTFNKYINIDRFTNLRMLTIREPSSENLDKIISKLHLLPDLSYLNIYSILLQSFDITEAIFKIQSLKSLILYSTESIIFNFKNNSSICPFTQLEYLEVDGCYIADFFELFKYVGSNVKRMKIRITYHRDTSIDPLIIDELLSNQGISTSLSRIEMNFNFLLLSNFHLILRLFPHLTHLTFSTLTDDIDFISPLVWYEFLSTYLLELKQLQFHIQIRGLLANIIQCPSTEAIESFYSMNSKWLCGPIIMDYHPLLNSPVLELYTCPQSTYIGKYSLELYGRKRYITTTITDGPINIDKNIRDLIITLNDSQQMSTTIDQLYETDGSYPKVTKLTIHSRMTTTSVENYNKISSVMSDILKSIPNLSKITSLSFTTDALNHAIYPSTALARRLLNKLPKINRLDLSYGYLLHLVKSPLIVNILSKKIESLTIVFDTHSPKLPDMIRILDIFSTRLCFLYFSVRMDFSATEFYFILPTLFNGKCKKLSRFQLRLYAKSRQQPQVLDEQFKARLKNCLTAQVERNKEKFGTMEYRIRDNEFSLSF